MNHDVKVNKRQILDDFHEDVKAQCTLQSKLPKFIKYFWIFWVSWNCNQLLCSPEDKESYDGVVFGIWSQKEGHGFESH